MFWRSNPDNADESQSGNSEWPRNGSLLTGAVHERQDMKWLEVSQWKQAGKDEWISKCTGIWMPFEQGGLLLHSV